MIEVSLVRGRGVALVDREDADRVLPHKWHLHRKGSRRYATARIDGRLISMHRLLMGEPPGLEVDHVNGNGLDNRRGNLRIATRAQNAQNQGPHCDGSSRYRGVSWSRQKNRWHVRLNLGGRCYHGGFFYDEDEAGERAAEMRRELMPYATS